MCGIVGYWGKRNVRDVIFRGLERIEYRGYDSAGMALVGDEMVVHKKKGKVADLKREINGAKSDSYIGIGHTRWATHGEPNDINAHPHRAFSKNLAIVHNGIVENFDSLKKELISKGYSFRSDTDTEVIIYLIEDIIKNESCSVEQAVRFALARIIGAYAIVVVACEPVNLLVAAKKGSSLIIGIGEDEFFLSSDAASMVEYTNEVVYLNDHEVATIKEGALEISDMSNTSLTPYIQTLDMELHAIEKNGYDHFMLKEIFEQPQSVKNSMRGRLDSLANRLVLGGLRECFAKLVEADRIIIVACGTSWHAGLTAEYFFEETCRIPVEVEYASEFRYRNPIIKKEDIVIAISQSGETADTLAAIELAKAKGATVLGVCNVVGSSLARNTYAGAYTHAGPEIGVASTKSFTAQLTVLYMMALAVAREKKLIDESRFQRYLIEIENIPAKIQSTLELDPKIREIARVFKDARNFIYLGRGYNFPVALEGALKLKEISYIHAEGYPAAEMKHGPIALIDEEMPVVFIATKDSSYKKVISNLHEIKARHGRLISIVTQGDESVRKWSKYVMEIPFTEEPFTPFISVIPLQLLSYHIAAMRNCDVDQPRNLAKSVTVE